MAKAYQKRADEILKKTAKGRALVKLQGATMKISRLGEAPDYRFSLVMSVLFWRGSVLH